MIGHARKYLTALIEIDFDTVADWARARNIGYTGFTSLALHPEVRRLLEGEIARVNRGAVARRADQGLPHPAQGARSGGRRRAGDADAQAQARARCSSASRRWSNRMYDDREEQLVAAGVGDALQDLTKEEDP